MAAAIALLTPQSEIAMVEAREPDHRTPVLGAPVQASADRSGVVRARATCSATAADMTGDAEAAAVRAAFAQQATWCREMGSPFTGLLMEVIGRDLDRTSAIGRHILDWPGL